MTGAARDAVLVALASALVLAGCDGSAPPPKAAVTTSATPRAIEPPAGVTLTPGGTALTVGQPASVVHRVGDSAASVITVTVAGATKGSIDDFRFFSLDDASKASTPYYVKVSVTNEGPGGLGGASLPMFARDETGADIPANDIVGTFDPCPVRTLPASFLPGASTELCLVYLVPAGRRLRGVALQTGTREDVITWRS